MRIDPDNPRDWESIAKELRAELLAIAHDVYPRASTTDPRPPRLYATTSTTTGLAGRIYSFIDCLDERTANRLAN